MPVPKPIKKDPSRRRLTGKQQKGLMVLVKGGTVPEAAAAAGVREDTVSKWLAMPHFRGLLDAEQQRRLRQVSSKLDAALPTAVETLVEIMKDPEVIASSRVRAAGILLDRALQRRTKVEVSGGMEASGTLPEALGVSLSALDTALGLLGDSVGDKP